jgi:hypothetical protein
MDMEQATQHGFRRGTAVRWHRDDVLLMAAVNGIFIANLTLSLAFPNEGIWVTERLDGYLINLASTLAGFYLLVPPLLLAESLIRNGGAGLPSAVSLAWWGTAVVAALTVATRFRAVPVGRRAVYAYFIAAQIAGFAAAHWSTTGN